MASQLIGLASTILRHPSTSPDGLTATQALAPSEPAVKQVSLARDIVNQAINGRILGDAATGMQLFGSAGGPLDDRKLLMEHLLARLAKMDASSPVRSAGEDQFLKLLWNDMPHPVTSLLTENHRFRQPDGSMNNLFCPELGAAGQPYARTVAPLHPKPANLPDPGLVFDCLLKRHKFTPQPSGISSMMFAFATLIIHTIFSTDYYDPCKNNTSSYLDLSVLYGSSEAQQKTVRLGPDSPMYGYGLLKPDAATEAKLYFMPPAVTALLTLFSRHHNYLAHMVYKLNERGEYADPSTLSEKDKQTQDHRIFNYARNINSAFFVEIILHDYVNSILGLNREKGTDFFLDAGKEIKGVLTGNVGRACGNVCSVEFSMVYRWHATLSKLDSTWMEGEMEKIFGKPGDQVSAEEFRARAAALVRGEATEGASGIDPSLTNGSDSYADKVKSKLENHKSGTKYPDPLTFTVPGLTRDPTTHQYNDDDLAQVLVNAIDEPAGAFQANHIPAVMRPIDVRGMESARKYGVCTMNEFRTYFGLKPFDSFQEWAGEGNEEVAAVAERLYTHIDDLELYPGLIAEAPKPGKMVGSGLATGHTISRAILSDAVSLVRGDRFYTTDYNPTTLTNWGFEYLASNQSDGSKGGMLKKLILKTLPNNFAFNSTYAMFPFQTPASSQEILKDQGIDAKYDFKTPKKAPVWKSIQTYAAAEAVLRDHQTFGVIYTEAMETIAKDRYGFMLGFDAKKKHDDDRAMLEATVFPVGYEQEYKDFYTRTVRDLIKTASWKTPNTSTFNMDFARDVARVASSRWATCYFGIPIKTQETPHGLITLQEFYLATAALFIYVFQDFEPVESFKLKEGALKAADLLKKIVEARIHQARGISGYLENLFKAPASILSPGPEAAALYKRLVNTGRSVDAMVSSVMGILVASSQNQGQAAAQILNVYLKPEYAEQKDALSAIAHRSGSAVEEALLRYTLEGQRLDPQTPGIPRFVRVDTTVQDGDKEISFKAGERLMVSLAHGNMDPKVFEEPEKIKLNRPMSAYRLFGWGQHNCQGSKIVNIAQPVILREMMALKNLRRAPGKAGQLLRIEEEFHGTPIHLYVTANCTLFPFPESMCIQYDA